MTEVAVLASKATISSARSAALELLRATRAGEFVDRAFANIATSLKPVDRRLAHELAYGVLRLKGRIDHILDALVVGGIASLHPEVLDSLRLGAYQILELDRVPAYAAVFDSVEAARGAGGKGAAALVNAVLRRLSESSYAAVAFPPLDSDPLGHLSTWGSHPRWLVSRWLSRWPIEDVCRLVDFNNSRPAVYLSIVGERDPALRRLREAGFEAVPAERAPGSIRLDSGNVGEALRHVRGVVQDPGAAAVVDYLLAPPGARVVDLCAAPGGKATLLAARGNEVLGVDVSRRRLQRLAENVQRLHPLPVQLLLADARYPPLAATELVLLDAPCTGTGTLARNPESRWRVRRRLKALTGLQRELLDAAARIVTPGGLLVYATCSLEPEENEGQVAGFLTRWPEFERHVVPTSGVSREFVDRNGDLRVLPQHHFTDGSYAARLRRKQD